MFGVDKNLQIDDFGTAFLYGGTMLLIGMLTIFTVLSLLWLFLTIFKVVFHDIPEKKKEKPAVVVESVVSTAPVAKDNSEEIVAVIAAAIAMAESENSEMKFRVVSFRRK